MKKEQTNNLFAAALTTLIGIVLFAASAQAKTVKIATANPGQDGAVAMDVALGTGVVKAGKKETVLLKVGLTGSDLKNAAARPPVNVAIVLDRSGSMSGEKMQKAKEAALAAVERLGPEDIVSLVVYDDTVDVLIPATKVRDKAALRRAIQRIRSGGSTALFAGVSKGAYEVRKFLDANRISRVVLVSDGLANVGPSSVGALGDLGASLMKEGISVTTVGLGMGYNEDLMVALASRSDGNHAFAENATDLARIFDHEFGDLLSVVARNVTIEIYLKGGATPMRTLGRKATITGNRVVCRLNQVYAKQEKFLLLEVAVPASFSGDTKEIAAVNLSYHDAVADQSITADNRAAIAYSDSAAAVEASQNRKVLIAGAELRANEQNKVAVDLMDKGQYEQAKKVLEKNAVYLEVSSKKWQSKRLKKRAIENRSDSKDMKSSAAPRRRKMMRSKQHALDNQMMWE